MMSLTNLRKNSISKPPVRHNFYVGFIFPILAEASLGTLVRGSSFRSSNRTIGSISNSLIDDNKYNVKQQWMKDGQEFPLGNTKAVSNPLKNTGDNIMNGGAYGSKFVFKLISIEGQQRFGSQPYNSSSYMGETTFSHSSVNRMNSVAYGPDGLAFGIVPKDIIDQIEQSGDDWTIRSMALEQIYQIVQEASSGKFIVSYAPSMLKFLCNILNNESSSKISSIVLKIINKVISFDKVNGQSVATHLIK